MQLKNIRPFSQYEPGDTVEVPDGAAFDPFHWEAVPPASSVPATAPTAPVTPAVALVTPEEM